MPKVPVEKLTTIYVGVDPGLGGGIAVLNNPFCGPELLPMPETELEIWTLVKNFRNLAGPVVVGIEWIHPAIQGISKGTMSKLYGNYAGLRMAITASGLPWEVIQPKEWCRGLGIPARKKGTPQSKWKALLRATAQRLYPKLTIWGTPKTKGLQLQVCDALLIATYLQRKLEGKLK